MSGETRTVVVVDRRRGFFSGCSTGCGFILCVIAAAIFLVYAMAKIVAWFA